MTTNIHFPTNPFPFQPSNSAMPGFPPVPVPMMQQQPMMSQEQKIQELENKIADLQKKLSNKSSEDVTSIESRLKSSPEYANYMALKQEGVLNILMNAALKHPETASEMESFLTKWKEKATAHLDTLKKS